MDIVSLHSFLASHYFTIVSYTRVFCNIFWSVDFSFYKMNTFLTLFTEAITERILVLGSVQQLQVARNDAAAFERFVMDQYDLGFIHFLGELD